MTNRVYVLAQFKPKGGKEAELFEVLKALEPDSYREEGGMHTVHAHSSN